MCLKTPPDILKDTKQSYNKKESVQPRFFRPCNVPYSQKEKVDKLTCLETAGIIETITSSDWAAPIVPVVNRDCSIKICGDYKLTANVATIYGILPIPENRGHICHPLGGKTFMKLDLAHSYNQLELDEESKKFTVISTSKGLYQYNFCHLECHQHQLFFRGLWKIFSRVFQECLCVLR